MLLPHVQNSKPVPRPFHTLPCSLVTTFGHASDLICLRRTYLAGNCLEDRLHPQDSAFHLHTLHFFHSLPFVSSISLWETGSVARPETVIHQPPTIDFSETTILTGRKQTVSTLHLLHTNTRTKGDSFLFLSFLYISVKLNSPQRQSIFGNCTANLSSTGKTHSKAV